MISKNRRPTVLAIVALILFFVLSLLLFGQFYVREPNWTLLSHISPARSQRKSWRPIQANYQLTEPVEASLQSRLMTQNTIKFLYMLQTESCLSDYLQEVISDPSVCPCDVMVLSYRTKCMVPPPSNVEYISVKNKTSWGGGRNVLYEAAMKREQIYLYFILMDDDIVLTDHLASERDSKGSPWRKFEEFLARVEPAAAAVDISDKHWLQRAAKGRKYLNCQSVVNASSAEYLSVADYDAAFNAFHNKSIRHILPYTSKFDRRGMWNFSPIYLNIKIEVLYAGHSVLHNQIFGTNSRHRSYPKRWPSLRDLNSIVDEVVNNLPQIRGRNSSLLSGWRKDGLAHEQRSPTVCIPPPPPKMPIVEFAYVDGKLAV